jgi:signal transduction histidine kinase
MKFTEKGKISIKTIYFNQPTYSLVVEVKDTGVGIAARDMRQLFTRFGKLQRTAELNNEGIGLGLTIVQQIV